MTIKVLSDYQVAELGSYFKHECDVLKIGIELESGDLIIEYENVGPYPALNKGLETIRIPNKQ